MATKALKKLYKHNFGFRRLPVSNERVENGTNGFSLFISDRIDLQIWHLYSFCRKFNVGLDKLFMFGIFSIFYCQNAWRTEGVWYDFSFQWFFHKISNFFKDMCYLKTFPISGLQKLWRNYIGTTSGFGDYRSPMNERKMERTVFRSLHTKSKTCRCRPNVM